MLPALGHHEAIEAFAAPIAVAAGLLPVAVTGHDRDSHAHQRTDVAIGFPVGAQDLDHLPAGAEGDRHLPHARVLGARIGVDGLQEPHLGLEARRAQRIFVPVEADIGAAGSLGIVAAVAALDGPHRVGGARQRALGQVGGMGIAHGLVLDGAQPETLRGVVGGLLETPVVERQHLGLAIFEEELAVIGAFEAVGEMTPGVVAVEAGAVEQRDGR